MAEDTDGLHPSALDRQTPTGMCKTLETDYRALDVADEPTSNRGGVLCSSPSSIFLVGLFTGAVSVGGLAFSWRTRSSVPSTPALFAASERSVVSSGTKGSVVSPGTRLRITNGCAADTLWLANFAFQTAHFPQNLRLEAGETKELSVPAHGLPATRFWAKWGCDDAGTNCMIGESGRPGERCQSAAGCSPPVDSKFEAVFGCLPDATSECAEDPMTPGQPLGPTDQWDVSHVAGYTLPYKVEVVGDCPLAPEVIDCSRLSLAQCPEKEDLGLPRGPQSMRLLSADERSVVACIAPCAKLVFAAQHGGLDFEPEAKEALEYCCPTPPVSEAQCARGPVVLTKYVQTVHEACPNVNAFAYDDGFGLGQCPAGTRYDVTFYCPT